MIEGNKNELTFANKCPWCGKEYTFTVPTEGYDKWVKGALIQNAFPHLTPTERDYFLTGYCADCQKKLFGDDEDE